MIAPYIIAERERKKRQADWEPIPLYIEATMPAEEEKERAPEAELSRVIIIDYGREE